MYQQHPCPVIDVDFFNQRIIARNKTKDLLHRAFGVTEAPTWDTFEPFLKERCFPAGRGNVKGLLAQLGLTCYDSLQIVEKTQGRMAGDDMWLKFHYYPRAGEAHGQH